MSDQKNPDERAKRRRRAKKASAAIERAERDQRAVELVLKGYTYRQIAEKLGVSGSGQAHKMARRAMTRRLGDADEELRALELERCRQANSQLWPKVDQPDPDQKAFEQLRWWLDYQAKLAGLYAPRRQQLEVEVQGAVAHDVTHRKLEAVRALEIVVDELVEADTGATDDRDEEVDDATGT